MYSDVWSGRRKMSARFLAFLASGELGRIPWFEMCRLLMKKKLKKYKNLFLLKALSFTIFLQKNLLWESFAWGGESNDMGLSLVESDHVTLEPLIGREWSRDTDSDPGIAKLVFKLLTITPKDRREGFFAMPPMVWGALCLVKTQLLFRSQFLELRPWSWFPPPTLETQIKPNQDWTGTFLFSLNSCPQDNNE